MIKYLCSIVSLLSLGLCHSEIYYSFQDYEVCYDMLNTPFYKNQTEIINQDNMVISLNALGQFDSPNMVDSIVLKNEEVIRQINESEKNPVIFTLFWSKPIKIDEMKMIVNGYRQDQSLSKSVYVNPSLSYSGEGNLIVNGEKIYHGKEKKMIRLSYPNECTSIAIVFDDLKVNDVVELQRFTIDQYQIKKHQYWSKNKIENTDTYRYESCVDSASFYPNGNKTYSYDAVSEFQIKKRVFESYIPKLTTTKGYYDYLRGNHIPAYSDPDLSRLDEYGQFVDGYIRLGLNATATMSFYSYGLSHDFYPYIIKNEDQALRYIALPIYWTQTSGLDHFIHKSENSGWCLHTTGSSKTPCYKYQGHSMNSRLNSYDVLVRTYENLIAPDEETYNYVKYYLNNQLTNQQTLIKENNDLETTFELNESGIYTIESHIYDIIGQMKVVRSNPFYIDRDPPTISYFPNGTWWSNEIKEVDVEIEDALSLVEGYTIMVNDVFNISKKVILDEEGIYEIKTTAYDHVKNNQQSTSEKYYLDFSDPLIKINSTQNGTNVEVIPSIHDELSGLLKWRYTLTQNDKVVYTSTWFDQGNEVFDFELNDDVKLFIEAYDQAGNMAKYEKKFYKKISLQTMGLFSKSFDVDEENTLWIHLKADNNEELKVEVSLDDELIYSEHKVLTNEENIAVPYHSDKEHIKMTLKVKNETSEEILELNIVQKTKLYQEGDVIDLSCVSASSIEKDHSQVDYYETLWMNLEPLENNYLQGQGLEIKVNVTYLNPCATYDQHTCQPLDILEEDLYLMIDNGALPYAQNYLMDGNYKVKFNTDSSIYELNEVFVSKKKGEVFISPPNEDHISGGNKWYLDSKISLGTHGFSVEAKDVGHNEFTIKLLGEYKVVRSLNDLYKVRYINPYDPYFKDDNKWNQYEAWFNEVRK